jgi:hypothetical protein
MSIAPAEHRAALSVAITQVDLAASAVCSCPQAYRQGACRGVMIVRNESKRQLKRRDRHDG